MPARPEVHFPLTSSGGSGPPPSVDDHFAPKYLVGNVPAGDPAVAQGAPFVYIPDPGDGTGIALALTQPNGPGDVWIRPGVYNLALAGAGPLLVPATIRVQGSGQTTIIQTRSTGNQGAFVLNQGSQLRDLNITTLASNENSVGSTAVVRSIGAAVIENVHVTFATAALGALRYGISFEASGAAPLGGEITALRNVQVQATTTTGIGSPTACYFTASLQQQSSFTVGFNVVASGGDMSLINNGIWIVKIFICVDWSQYGIWVPSGGGTFRCDESLVAATAVPAAAPIGIYLQGGGGHLLQAMTVQVPVAGSRGIIADDPGGGGAGGIDVSDCFVFADLEGIRLGSATFGIGGSTIMNTNVQSGGLSIVIGQNADSTEVRGCVINTGNAFAAPDVGIESRGSRTLIVHNLVTVQDNPAVGTAMGIRSFGSRSVCSNNVVNVAGTEGVHIEGERTTVVGNTIEISPSTAATSTCIHLTTSAIRSTVGDNDGTNPQPYTVPAIIIDASRCSVGDNTTVVIAGDPGATPGISLTGNDCTCIGNVCEGSSVVPVINTGTGNEIAHNVGA